MAYDLRPFQEHVGKSCRVNRVAPYRFDVVKKGKCLGHNTWCGGFYKVMPPPSYVCWFISPMNTSSLYPPSTIVFTKLQTNLDEYGAPVRSKNCFKASRHQGIGNLQRFWRFWSSSIKDGISTHLQPWLPWSEDWDFNIFPPRCSSTMSRNSWLLDPGR